MDLEGRRGAWRSEAMGGAMRYPFGQNRHHKQPSKCSHLVPFQISPTKAMGMQLHGVSRAMHGWSYAKTLSLSFCSLLTLFFSLFSSLHTLLVSINLSKNSLFNVSSSFILSVAQFSYSFFSLLPPLPSRLVIPTLLASTNIPPPPSPPQPSPRAFPKPPHLPTPRKAFPPRYIETSTPPLQRPVAIYPFISPHIVSL